MPFSVALDLQKDWFCCFVHEWIAGNLPAAAALECIEANLVNCFFILNASFCVIKIQREQIDNCYRIRVFIYAGKSSEIGLVSLDVWLSY